MAIERDQIGWTPPTPEHVLAQARDTLTHYKADDLMPMLGLDEPEVQPASPRVCKRGHDQAEHERIGSTGRRSCRACELIRRDERRAAA